MLLEIYIITFILSIILLFTGLILGKNYNKMSLEGNNKKGVILTFFLFSLIFMIITSYASLNIETEHCEGITVSSSTIGNTTTYNETLTCQNNQHVETGLAGVFSFFVIITIILLLYYTFYK